MIIEPREQAMTTDPTPTALDPENPAATDQPATRVPRIATAFLATATLVVHGHQINDGVVYCRNRDGYIYQVIGEKAIDAFKAHISGVGLLLSGYPHSTPDGLILEFVALRLLKAEERPPSRFRIKGIIALDDWNNGVYRVLIVPESPSIPSFELLTQPQPRFQPPAAVSALHFEGVEYPYIAVAITGILKNGHLSIVWLAHQPLVYFGQGLRRALGLPPLVEAPAAPAQVIVAPAQVIAAPTTSNTPAAVPVSPFIDYGVGLHYLLVLHLQQVHLVKTKKGHQVLAGVDASNETQQITVPTGLEAALATAMQRQGQAPRLLVAVEHLNSQRQPDNLLLLKLLASDLDPVTQGSTDTRFLVQGLAQAASLASRPQVLVIPRDPKQPPMPLALAPLSAQLRQQALALPSEPRFAAMGALPLRLEGRVVAGKLEVERLKRGKIEVNQRLEALLGL
jgi:hypothetical protein